MDHCLGCKRHCIKDDLHCERGRMYFCNDETMQDDELYSLLKNIMHAHKKSILSKLKSYKPVSMKKLEKKLDISHEQCKVEIKKLENEGKVYRKQEDDTIYIYLTEKGKKEKEQFHTKQIFTCLDEIEKQELKRILEKIITYNKGI